MDNRESRPERARERMKAEHMPETPTAAITGVEIVSPGPASGIRWDVERDDRRGSEHIVIRVRNDGELPARVSALHVSLTLPVRRETQVRLLELGLQSTDIDVGVVELAPGATYVAEHAAVASLAPGHHVVIGFATAERFLTSVRATRHPDELSLVATCLTDPVTLAPGESFASETLVVIADESVHEALDVYGEACGELMGTRTRFPVPPTGWLSWYCFYGDVTEQDVLDQIDALTTGYAGARPEYIVIDSGWYSETGWGDWEANEKFPHGMRWLADRIRAAGFVPGLWLSPLLVAATSRLARERPELLLRDGAGQPVPTMGTAQWDTTRATGPRIDVVEDAAIRFALDLGSDAVHEWLDELFTRVRHEWGYEFVKLDFLVRAMITDRGLSPQRPGRGHDLVAHSGLTAVEAYRRAMATIRRAVGDDCFVLGCAAPLVASGGDLIDANRMTPDITRRDYGGTPAPGRPSSWDLVVMCARSMATRRFLNGRLGWNDPDVIVVRDEPVPGITDSFSPSLDEARVWATIVALSAGVTFLGDDLARLSPERRELTRLVFPPLARAATPWDLFSAPAPRVWVGSFAPAGASDAEAPRFVAVVNWEDLDAVVTIPPDALRAVGIGAADASVTVDVWTGTVEEHAAPGRDGIAMRLPGRSVRWLRVTADPGAPAVVGATIRHVATGGAGSDDGAGSDGGRRLVILPELGDADTARVLVYVPDDVELLAASHRVSPVTEHVVELVVTADDPIALDFAPPARTRR